MLFETNQLFMLIENEILHTRMKMRGIQRAPDGMLRTKNPVKDAPETRALALTLA